MTCNQRTLTAVIETVRKRVDDRTFRTIVADLCEVPGDKRFRDIVTMLSLEVGTAPKRRRRVVTEQKDEVVV